MLGLLFFSLYGKKQVISEHNQQKFRPVSSYHFPVLDHWMRLQIRLMSTTMANFNGPFVRIYSYSGLAAYEAILPGFEKNSKYLLDHAAFNQFPSMPQIEKSKNYHWPSSLNAALAFMNRAMFPAATTENKLAIDSLENYFTEKFLTESDAGTVERSALFGKSVAQKIFEWSETDGYRRANDPYNPPIGPGKWVPTAPGYVRAITPYLGRLRTMVTNSIANADPPSPPPYSEDSNSIFYKMNHEVYYVNQQLTATQKEFVAFWRDINPGVTAPGHWLNILRQVLLKEKDSRLDRATYAYALTGLALNDAWISSWKTRYEYNLLRPITYIRQVMGYKDWLPVLITPPHPEYTAGFAAMAGAVSESLTAVFGNNYKLTDHTYDEYDMKARSYNSFHEMASEASDSKFYGGIHYKLSVDAGLLQGRQIARNVVSIVTGKKSQALP